MARPRAGWAALQGSLWMGKGAVQGPHLSPNSRPGSSPSPFSVFSRKATPDCKGAWETASVWAAVSPGSINLGKSLAHGSQRPLLGR